MMFVLDVCCVVSQHSWPLYVLPFVFLWKTFYESEYSQNCRFNTNLTTCLFIMNQTLNACTRYASTGQATVAEHSSCLLCL